jgi:hypothetical protein
MSENQQITYMQARIVRLAAEEWNMSIKDVVSMFTEFKVLHYIRECFGIFHVEGDYAVLDDIVGYLDNKGVKVDAGID